MTLDLSSFQKALATLEEALSAYQKDPKNAFIRDACIQRFEYSYELAYKMLKRFLESTEQNPTAIEEMTFNEIIRSGYEKGLLKAPIEEWRAFRTNRGTTSHTYDEKKAEIVFQGITPFLIEARFLLTQIQKRQGD